MKDICYKIEKLFEKNGVIIKSNYKKFRPVSNSISFYREIVRPFTCMVIHIYTFKKVNLDIKRSMNKTGNFLIYLNLINYNDKRNKID